MKFNIYMYMIDFFETNIHEKQSLMYDIQIC